MVLTACFISNIILGKLWASFWHTRHCPVRPGPRTLWLEGVGVSCLLSSERAKEPVCTGCGQGVQRGLLSGHGGTATWPLNEGLARVSLCEGEMPPP